MQKSYSYQIISVDVQAGVMEVVYTAEGKPPHHVGVRLPYEGESIEAVIDQASPLPYWNEQEMPRVVPQVGSSGVVDHTPPIDPREPLVIAKEKKYEEITNWRYMMEIKGVNVGGAVIRTDRESQAQVTGEFTSLQSGLIPHVDFKAAGGVWVTLTLQEMTPIAQAVSQHVQSCFTAEKEMCALVEVAQTVEEVEDITMPTEVF